MSTFKDAAGYRAFNQDKSKAITFLAADDFTTTGAPFISVKNANYTLYIQKIVVDVSTINAATLTFQDTAGTPVVCGKLAGSAALGQQIVLDGGGIGIPLTQGKNLSIIASAAGIAGSVVVECYQRMTAVTDATSGASNQ